MTYWFWVLAGLIWIVAGIMVSALLCLGIRRRNRQDDWLRQPPEERP